MVIYLCCKKMVFTVTRTKYPHILSNLELKRLDIVYSNFIYLLTSLDLAELTKWHHCCSCRLQHCSNFLVKPKNFRTALHLRRPYKYVSCVSWTVAYHTQLVMLLHFLPPPGTTGIIPSKARWEKKQKARLRSVAFQGKNNTDARVSKFCIHINEMQGSLENLSWFRKVSKYLSRILYNCSLCLK